MEPNPTLHRRRQYYIKRPFQRRFIVQFCALITVGCALFGAALYVYSKRTLTTAFIDSKLQVMSTADFLLPAIGLFALLITALITLAAAIRLLFFSHQIAGPLYRLEKTAKEIGAGDFSFRIKLRSGDELQDLANSMDQMLDELRPRIKNIKDSVESLDRVVAVARENEVSAEVKKKLEEIVQYLKKELGHFRG